MLDAITYDMITLVGPPGGDQTRLGRTERHLRADIGAGRQVQVGRHSIRPTIDLTVDPRVPVSFRSSVSGAIPWCSAMGCITVRTEPAPPHSGVARCQDHILLLASLGMGMLGHRDSPGHVGGTSFNQRLGNDRSASRKRRRDYESCREVRVMAKRAVRHAARLEHPDAREASP